MADYTLKHTGLQIDEALTSALDVKRVRGIVKMTDSGPAAAVPGVDYPDSSGSTVDVTGILKGVRNAETGEIEIQQAAAGTDYQTPLTPGVDYASPSAVSNKQNKITAQGLLKGLGDGSVAEAVPGEDYQSPILAGTYAAPAISRTITLGVAAWTGAEAPFTQTVNVTDMTDNANAVVSPAPASLIDYGAAQVRCITQGSGTLTFACESAPESDLTVNVLIVR